jgi:hypothetical protein
MSQSIYLHTQLKFSTLEEVIEAFREEFDHFLKDSFTEFELEHFEKQIDSIAAVYVQPMLEDLSFDDFYADPVFENDQRMFFERCKSTVVLENLPYLETNSFQVSYLKLLLSKFDDLLIDRGGVSELCFKDQFVKDLSKYKTVDGMLKPVEKVVEVKTSKPVDPIDFLIIDVYKELNRLKGVPVNPEGLPPKIVKIFAVMETESKLGADSLLRKTSLNPKDLDDGLERLKFWLRKI